MEITFRETFHKFSKAEKGVSSQWYDVHSLHNSLRALGGKVLFKGYIWISATVRGEEYLVPVKMLNAYNNIIISSLSQALNETSAHEQI